MKQEDLDKLFRDKLKERDFEMSESAWASMEQKLDEGSKKGGAAWAFFLVGIALAAGIWAFWHEGENQAVAASQLLSENKANQEVDSSENADTKTIEISNENSTSKSIKSFSEIDLNESVLNGQGMNSSDQGFQNTDGNADSSAGEKGDADHLKKAGSNIKRSTNEKNANRENESDDGNHLSNLKAGKTYDTDFGNRVNSNSDGNDNNSGRPDRNGKESEREINSEEGQVERQNENSSNGTDISDAGDANKKSSIYGQEINKRDENTGDSNNGSGVSELSDKTLNSEEELELAHLIYSEVETQEPNLTLNDEEFYVPKKLPSNKWNAEAGLFYGISSVSKSLSTSNANWQSAIDFRNTNEGNVWKPEFGLELGLFKNNLTVRSGLTKGEFGEEVAYTNSLLDSLVIDQSFEYQYVDTMYWDFVFDTTGVVIDSTLITTIVDSILIVTIDSTIVSYSNNLDARNGKTSISYSEIPLVFGYRINKGKWEFNPEAGLAVGFLKVKNGYYVSNENDELIQIGEETILKKTILNAIYGLRLRYEISPKFKLNVNLGQRRNLNSIFEDSEISQKYTSSFLRFGVQYVF